MPAVMTEPERLRAHLDHGLVPPMGAAYTDAVAAIIAVVEGRPDEVVLRDDDGEPVAFAHHLVRVWELESFVEVRRMQANTKILTTPWWVVEGYVVASGMYPLVADDKILTNLGVATLLEPAVGVEPTAFSVML